MKIYSQLVVDCFVRFVLIWFIGLGLKLAGLWLKHLNDVDMSTEREWFYAQTLILVKLIVVTTICFLIITRNPVGISGPY